MTLMIWLESRGLKGDGIYFNGHSFLDQLNTHQECNRAAMKTLNGHPGLSLVDGSEKAK